jgi:CO/xanthine dehydrogenase FAD-binding subunit
MPELLFPASAQEAASLFGDGAGVTVFAGGTILLPLITHGRVRPERTLLLGRAGLDAVEQDGAALRIGAAATVAALAGAPARALDLESTVGEGRAVRDASPTARSRGST